MLVHPSWQLGEQVGSGLGNVPHSLVGIVEAARQGHRPPVPMLSWLSLSLHVLRISGSRSRISCQVLALAPPPPAHPS